MAGLLVLAACTRSEQPSVESVPKPAQVTQAERSNAMQLQFRFKPEQSLADIDPSRIEAAVRPLSYVESFDIYDDRHSDAMFVTLVVTLRQAETEQLADLQRALRQIARVHVFAVDPSGGLTPLESLPPERLPDAARHVR